MSDFENAIIDNETAEESFDFEELEEKLTSNLDEELSDLQFLKEDREKIGNPDSLGSTVMNVVWEQFVNQIGAVAGEDFIKDNRELLNHGEKTERGASLSEDDIKAYHLDLRKEAHIQTTENFAEGKIATHNSKIDYQKRYDDWQSNFVKDENGNVVMHDTRVNKRDDKGNVIYGSDGKPVKKQAETLADGYRKPFDKVRNERGLVGNKEKGTAMDETVSVGEIVRDPAANAHMTKEEQIEFDLSEKNLNEIDAHWNSSKGDTPTNEWLDNPNSKGQKPQEIFDNMTDEDAEKLRQKDAEARAEYEKQKKEAEQRSIAAGKQSRKEEAFRIGGKALRAAVMGLLASLIKTIVQKFIAWLRSKDKSFNTFIEQLKEAIKTFISNLKQNVLTAGNTVGTTILAAIFGPIVSTIKKAWIFLKQGAKSLKEAIDYVKNPDNRNKPVSILLIEVGKIVMAGVTAAGAIVLGEVIEKGLSTIPGFGVDIPLIGSLANILGIFLGALVSGLIGALALNLMDRAIASIEKRNNTRQQIEKGNDILGTQAELIKVKADKLAYTEEKVASAVREHHEAAEEIIRDAVNDMTKMNKQSENTKDEIDRLLITLQEN